MKVHIACLAVLLVVPLDAAADEIRLKDGTKIVGTIVGFEDEAFRVQTSYGFALVRKDKVAAIIPSSERPQTKQAAADRKASAQDATSGTAPSPARADSVPGAKRPPQEAKSPERARASKGPGSSADQATTWAPAQLAAPAPDSPPAEATPAPISEEVNGNLYVNHTYGFRMYKPPGWHLIEGAQTVLPAAVTAMGTPDESTVFVVGRERMEKSLDAHAAATEKQLREIYVNYRRISEERTRVAALPALVRRYRGTADERDWSGVVITLARGKEIFTILGMTYADSDLIQIQENVIARAIASLEFTSR